MSTVKNTVENMYSIQEQITYLERQCSILGGSFLGDSYEGCWLDLEAKTLTIYEDCGHEFDSDEYCYNSKGEPCE